MDPKQFARTALDVVSGLLAAKAPAAGTIRCGVSAIAISAIGGAAAVGDEHGALCCGAFGTGHVAGEVAAGEGMNGHGGSRLKFVCML